MIKYKIKELLASRGIVYPHAWLTNKCDFNDNKATKYLSGKQQSINREDLSFICGVLNCTPNDIMYWEDTPRMKLEPTHPLRTELSPPTPGSDWPKLLRNISTDTASRIHQIAVDEMAGGSKTSTTEGESQNE